MGVPNWGKIVQNQWRFLVTLVASGRGSKRMGSCHMNVFTLYYTLNDDLIQSRRYGEVWGSPMGVPK